MAKTQTPPVPAAADIDPAATYAVRVSVAFAFNGADLGPLAGIQTTGAWLADLLASEHAAKVVAATKL